jgi:hypothetical protein
MFSLPFLKNPHTLPASLPVLPVPLLQSLLCSVFLSPRVLLIPPHSSPTRDSLSLRIRRCSSEKCNRHREKFSPENPSCFRQSLGNDLLRQSSYKSTWGFLKCGTAVPFFRPFILKMAGRLPAGKVSFHFLLSLSQHFLHKLRIKAQSIRTAS